MGSVYKVRDQELETVLALKTLNNIDPQAILSIKREFRSLKDVRHSNLIRMKELFNDDGQWFFTMELVNGKNLAQIIYETRLSQLASESNEPIFQQLADGITALHDRGKLHRDIKPTNIMVEPTGRVVLLDFGLAIDNETVSGRSTAYASLTGTLPYMAPESLTHSIHSSASDWYSFGAVLYEALTGSMLFPGNAAEIFLKKTDASFPSSIQWPEESPKVLRELCADLIQVSPERRPCQREIVHRLKRITGAFSPERPVPESQRSRVMPRLVGRTPETELIYQAYTRSNGQHAEAVCLVGESGIGKSAILDAFAHQVSEGRPSLLLRSQCRRNESVQYRALDPVMDSVAAFLSDGRNDATRGILDRIEGGILIARAFPVFGLLSNPTHDHQEATKDPHEARQQTFRAIRALFREVCRQTRVTIIVDDFQWADTDSMLLLKELLREPYEPPIFFLFAQRHDNALEVTLDKNITRLFLRSLSQEHSYELAKHLLGADQAHCDDIMAVARIAQGHPLYTGELVRFVHQKGQLNRRLNLKDVIQWRLSRLGYEDRRIVTFLAISGMPISANIVSRAASVEMGSLSKTLEKLEDLHLVRSDAVRRDHKVELYHDKVREAVVSSLSSHERRELHRKLARAIESEIRGHPQQELLMHHLEGAGELRKATRYGLEEARRSFAMLAFDQAASLYEKVLQFQVLHGTQLVETHLAMADALANAGRGADAAQAYLEVPSDDVPHIRLDILRKASEALLKAGHIPRGIEVLRMALKEAGVRYPETPTAALRSILRNRMVLFFNRYRWKERAVEEITPSDISILDLYRGAARGLSLIDSVRGADFQSRATVYSLRLGERKRVLECLMYEAAFAGCGGGSGIPKAHKILDKVQMSVVKDDGPETTITLRSMRALLRYFDGDFEHAAVEFRYCEHVLRNGTVGTTWEIDAVRLMELWCLRNMGHFRELQKCYRRYVREAEQRGNLFMAETLKRGFVLVMLLQDDILSARRVADAPWRGFAERFDMQDWYSVYAKIELALYCGASKGTMLHLQACAKECAGSALARVVAPIRRDAISLQGRLAVASRDLQTARMTATLLRGERLKYCVLWSNLLFAGIAFQRRQIDKALTLLERSLDQANVLNMASTAAVIGCRLGQVGNNSTLFEESAARLQAEGIRNPTSFCDVLVPGFSV